MSQVITDTPYKIEALNYSWENVRACTDDLTQRFPESYRMAYFNDYYQKLILLINKNFFSLDMADTQILIISKIDSSKEEGLYSFEVKSYYGNISSQKDVDKGWSSLKNVSSYLKLNEA